MFGEDWDVTLYMVANKTSRQLPTASRDLYLGGGASLWLGLKNLPDFVAGVDFNKFSSTEAVSFSLYRDWDITLSLDFSKYVRIDQKDRQTFLKLSHHIQGITSAEGDVGRAEDINHALVFLFGTWF